MELVSNQDLIAEVLLVTIAAKRAAQSIGMFIDKIREVEERVEVGLLCMEEIVKKRREEEWWEKG